MSEQGWEAADPKTVLQFTAVGWFFARELESRLGVPIGLVNCSYGGTPAEGWMHEDELKDFPAYRDRALPFRDTALVAEIIRRDKALSDGWLKTIQALDDIQAKGWQQPSTDVSSWMGLQVPGYWADQGMADSGGAVVWYRREVDLPASMAGQPAVLLVSPTLRPVLARFLRSSVPQMQVIAWNEIPDNRKVRLVSTIGT